MLRNNLLQQLAIQPVAERLTRRSRSSGRGGRHHELILELIDDDLNAIPFSSFDLSPVGAYLHSDFLLMRGDFVRLRLWLSFRHQPIEIVAEVIRVGTGEEGLPPGMGVAFRDMAKRDAAELKDFLLKRVLGNG